MFMADLCYISIYIIKWFLKLPACFVFEAIRSTKTILIEVCLLLNKYDEKKSLLNCYRISIFKKETFKSNTTVLNNSAC